jgi:ABC-2 type transport system ATP-binding protein
MVHVENLTKYYNELCAVDRISLDIRKGEVLGLLGPNGAGKTTTLKMLTGFLKPTSGQIRVKDYRIPEDSLEIRKMMGYLPESAPLYYEMLVFDYLNFIAGLRCLDGSEKFLRIRNLAKLCGLNSVMHKPISELSKGYKQRVGLAHAMMSDPEILILDEPTSGLDPNQIVEIREIIREIGKEKTIILSTHILSEAEATCDRAVIINNGKIAADDYTKNLKISMEGEKFLRICLENAQRETVKKILLSIDGVTGIAEISPESDPIQIKLKCQSSKDIRSEVYRRIKQNDWVLLEFRQESQTLETIFRELTQEN